MGIVDFEHTIIYHIMGYHYHNFRDKRDIMRIFWNTDVENQWGNPCRFNDLKMVDFPPP